MVGSKNKTAPRRRPRPAGGGRIRSILTALDDTPACAEARRFALELARRSGATLRGVTAIDLEDLEEDEAAPIGGIAIAGQRREHRRRQARERRLRMAKLPLELQEACAAAGVATAQAVTLEEDIQGGLVRLVETSDLLVIGRDAQFHLTELDEAAPLVEHVLKHGARPVVVCGTLAVTHGTVLVAYDGSAPAARALQIAVALGMFDGASAHVLTVHATRAAAEEIAARAGDFLTLHGIERKIEACESTDNPADVLLARAGKIRAGLLVMGAFGHRGLREALFGSSTRQLYDTAPLPLFIHH